MHVYLSMKIWKCTKEPFRCVSKTKCLTPLVSSLSTLNRVSIPCIGTALIAGRTFIILFYMFLLTMRLSYVLFNDFYIYLLPLVKCAIRCPTHPLSKNIGQNVSNLLSNSSTNFREKE